MYTKEFWLDTAERAIKTFVQVLLATFAISGTTLLNADWGGVLATGGTAAFVSLLTSLVSATVNKAGDDEPVTASVVSDVTYRPPVENL